jgi:hypothetical protein
MERVADPDGRSSVSVLLEQGGTVQDADRKEKGKEKGAGLADFTGNGGTY